MIRRTKGKTKYLLFDQKKSGKTVKNKRSTMAPTTRLQEPSFKMFSATRCETTLITTTRNFTIIGKKFDLNHSAASSNTQQVNTNSF